MTTVSRGSLKSKMPRYGTPMVRIFFQLLTHIYEGRLISSRNCFITEI